MSTYEELSRRGLIQLNHDYDKDNDDALAKYLDAAGGTSHYEEVKPAEQIFEKAENMAEKLTDAGTSVAYNLLDKMTEKLSEFIDGMADDIADGSDLTEGVPQDG